MRSCVCVFMRVFYIISAGHPSQQGPGIRRGTAGGIRTVPPRAPAALHPRAQMRRGPGGHAPRARSEAPRPSGTGIDFKK